MRIVGGQHRGTKLAEVGKGDNSAHLRPTTDRVRENLFNVLAGGRFGDPLRDAFVLDLFAGTGALGLEALSRGAKHVTFVENGNAAASLIHENIQKLKRRGDTTLIKADATELHAANQACSLVFMDPPYGKSLGGKALARAHEGGWVAPGAIVVWEESTAQIAPKGFVLKDQRRYGDSWVTFLECTEW